MVEGNTGLAQDNIHENTVFKSIADTYSTTDIRTVYAFERLIGGGHFGSVRIAHRITDPQVKYAIKSILKENIKKDVKLLEEELAILTQVDHPNIIKFHETYIDYRYVHIVMELCEGGELFEKIVEMHKFTEKQAAGLMKKILSAVKHLHEHGICHRDLKPENFLLSDNSEDAEIKLIDFGLSKRFGAIQESHPEEKMHTIVGTPYYVAPEVLKGSYDFKCDVWSMGVILYIMLCGYPPFEGDNNKEIFKRVLQQKLDFDPEDWDAISDEAKELIQAMLQKDPANRISVNECLGHRWFDITQTSTYFDKKILTRINDFKAPQRLQMETLTFLVSNIHSEGDFKTLKDSFRVLDRNNNGILTLKELQDAFTACNVQPQNLEETFKSIDVQGIQKITYRPFLASTVEKTVLLTMNNLWFAFHHFDVYNQSFITEDGLVEVFRRQGQKISKEKIHEMVKEVDPQNKGKISFEDFSRLMQETLSPKTNPSKHFKMNSL